MCQLQLIHKFNNKKLNGEDKIAFADLMLLGNASNSDAWGMSTTQGLIYKEGKEFDYELCLNKLKDVECITLLGHNRFKTHGLATNNDNNHPFETEHFIIAHNGVLSNSDELKKEYNLTYTEEVDSYIIPALMEHFYNQENIVENIKSMIELIRGSYSIIIINKADGKIYYMKNSNTQFHFGLIDDKDCEVLIGTTDKDNLDECYTVEKHGFLIQKRKVYILKPDALKIYEINSEEIVTLDSFKEATYAYKHCSLQGYCGGKNETNSHQNNSMINNSFIDMKRQLKLVSDTLIRDLESSGGISVLKANIKGEYVNSTAQTVPFNNLELDRELMHTYIDDLGKKHPLLSIRYDALPKTYKVYLKTNLPKEFNDFMARLNEDTILTNIAYSLDYYNDLLRVRFPTHNQSITLTNYEDLKSSFNNLNISYETNNLTNYLVVGVKNVVKNNNSKFRQVIHNKSEFKRIAKGFKDVLEQKLPVDICNVKAKHKNGIMKFTVKATFKLESDLSTIEDLFGTNYYIKINQRKTGLYNLYLYDKLCHNFEEFNDTSEVVRDSQEILDRNLMGDIQNLRNDLEEYFDNNTDLDIIDLIVEADNKLTIYVNGSIESKDMDDLQDKFTDITFQRTYRKNSDSTIITCIIRGEYEHDISDVEELYTDENGSMWANKNGIFQYRGSVEDI